MARASLSASVQRMGRVLRLHDDDAKRTDAELLRRYVVERHEASFTMLVHRHGRTVHAVCRRMLRQHADAEDATQAVFIILMRRAGTIRNPEIGSWLHGVAVRVCLKLRASTDRRRCETLTDEPFATETSPEQREIAMILDEELAALPGKYRSAMIECDVLERSRSEAAKLLGWPEGTVATRLAKARQLMADKLRQRGVTLGVTALSVMLGSTRFSVAMPRLWDGPTTSAHLLANGVLRTMSYSNYIWRSVAGLLLLSSLSTAVMLVPAGDTPVSVSDSAVSLVLAPVPEPSTEVWKERQPIGLKDWQAGSLSFSTDGAKLLVAGTDKHAMFYDMGSSAITSINPKGRTGFTVAAFDPSGSNYAIASEKEVVYYDLDSNPMNVHQIRYKIPSPPFAMSITPAHEDVRLITSINKVKQMKKFMVQCVSVASPTLVSYRQWSLSHKPDGGIARSVPVGMDLFAISDKGNKGRNFDPYATPIAANPAGKQIVKLSVVDIKTLEVSAPLDAESGNGFLKGHDEAVVCAAWSEDGSTIVTGDAGGTIIVWDAKTYRETHRFNIDKHRIGSIDTTKDGKRIAVATISNDKAKHSENIYVWDVDNPPKIFKPIAEPSHIDSAFTGVASIKFTPDGQTLAASFCNFDRAKDQQGGRVRIWDLKSRK